jgi:S-adenosylmethionine/arginine decarboxylase-like enzyme
MTPYGDAWYDRFGKGDRRGWSVIQPIEESTVVVHCDPPTLAAIVGITTCGRLNADAATEALKIYFAAKYTEQCEWDRGAPA